jgi:hypothetical protein
MSIFSRSRRKSTTPFVLALWLFALAASIAHACGLDEAFAQAGWGEHASVGRQAPGHGALPACDRFCSDDIPLLKSLKAVEDSPAGVALPAPASASSASVVAHPRTIEVRSGSDPPPDLAINTRFVRLAL